MEVRKVRVLRGPNCWARVGVLEAWVSAGPFDRLSADEMAAIVARIATWLPSLARLSERPSADGDGQASAVEPGRGDVHWADLLANVAAELAREARATGDYCAKRPTAEPDVYRIAIACQEESLVRACLASAREICRAAAADSPLDISALVRKLRELADQVCLGPSTKAIVSAAAARGIPFRRLNAGSLVQLGQGIDQQRVCTAETGRTGAVSESIAQDKELTKTLLRTVGVPVPQGRIVESVDDAWRAALDIGLPVVVKPQDANHGRGVFTNLTSREQVEKCFAVAELEGSGVIVEQFAPGVEHRLLVVNGQMVAAVRGDPVHVVGDGTHTIRHLIETQLNSDPRRSNYWNTSLPVVEIEPRALMMLEQQGYHADSVPPAGAAVLILGIGNLDTDVTDQVHPDVAARAVEAATAIGLDIAGVDAVMEDVSRPMEQQRGMVVEVNAGPGLQIHLEPSRGRPRPVGEAIVDSLFPPGRSGRIPIVAISGDSRAAIIAHILAHLISARFSLVGAASREGTWIGNRSIDTTDGCSAQAVDRVLLHPAVDAAVFEVSSANVEREGLGFDLANVVVVSTSDAQASGTRHEAEEHHESAEVLRTLVDSLASDGALVLDACDRRTAELAKQTASEIVLFCSAADHALAREHASRGGRVVLARDGRIIVCHQKREVVFDWPRPGAATGCDSGASVLGLDQVLPAVAAAVALGLAPEKIGAQLARYWPADTAPAAH